MTDTLDVDMLEAGINLLRAVPGLTVYESPLPNPMPSPPFVAVRGTVSWPDDPDGMSLDGLVSRAIVRWFTYSVGETQRAAWEVAQLVRGALLNVRPVIAGMLPGFIRDDFEGEPDPDETTGDVLVTVTHTYRLTCDS